MIDVSGVRRSCEMSATNSSLTRSASTQPRERRDPLERAQDRRRGARTTRHAARRSRSTAITTAGTSSGACRQSWTSRTTGAASRAPRRSGDAHAADPELARRRGARLRELVASTDAARPRPRARTRGASRRRRSCPPCTSSMLSAVDLVGDEERHDAGDEKEESGRPPRRRDEEAREAPRAGRCPSSGRRRETARSPSEPGPSTIGRRCTPTARARMRSVKITRFAERRAGDGARPPARAASRGPREQRIARRGRPSRRPTGTGGSSRIVETMSPIAKQRLPSAKRSHGRRAFGRLRRTPATIASAAAKPMPS